MPVTKPGKSSGTNDRGKRCLAGTNLRVFPILLGLMTIFVVPVSAYANTVADWDFTKGTQGWTGNNRVEKLISSQEGLLVKSKGQDPWIEGPVIDLAGEKMIRVKIRLKSNADTSAELFYGRAFRAGHSVRFTAQNDGRWHDYSLVIREILGKGTRFRLDPCTGEGQITVAFIKVEAIGEIVVPSLEKPERPIKIGSNGLLVKSGSLEFEHYGGGWGNFIVKVDSVEMAVGYECELLGVVLDESPEWLNLKNAKVTFRSKPEGEFRGIAVITDSRGAKWEIQRSIRPAKQEGTLIVETELKVNKDRDIVHIPWLTIFPGLGTFGERKSQGLFAGVEYLCDEPSSSTADIEIPEHVRRIPEPVKITFPFMAIAHNGNYIGVIWEPCDMVAATFDSPDRIYNSGAHVMSLSGPAVGELRFENEFCAHTPFKLEANKPVKVSVLIVGGKGETIVPAIKKYVELKGLPAVPEFEGGFGAAVNLLTHGWLDSQISHDGLFRHAVWGDNFPPAPAADAAVFIDWLANNTKDEKLCERLNSAKNRALMKIPTGQPFSSSVGHAHLPTAPFIFGRTYEFMQRRHSEALGLLRNFDEDGIKLYKPGKTDYSRTHFAKHANGLSGRDMVSILEGAALSGDKELISKALKLLDKQTSLYADTVPRGAQTWEVPLHTPDILASAHMVKAYTLGYIISGGEKYLEQARYWAWTGLPFVYLYPPTSGRVGPYSTIAVLGATNWRAPLWLGRPVQWCGLVYCSALQMLSVCDTKGPWEKIAKGITTAGLQMSWPVTDKERQGLLPDFFDLKAQIGAGPAINPGTVQAHLSELYDKGKIYDVKKLTGSGWFIHAPCAISGVREDKKTAAFVADGWGDKQYYVLVSGIAREPRDVLARGVVQESAEPSAFESAEREFHGEYGSLVVRLQGKSEIRIR
ncbi:MAG TPA: hypothetical protein VMW72_14965 [Sedimentisphaerales bacterium]|nr:hypothetical protein [Sedimentisphaerales bacterium]